MKQTLRRTITLKRETLRKLSDACLAGAVAGVEQAGPGRRGTGPVDSCEDCTLSPPTGG